MKFDRALRRLFRFVVPPHQDNLPILALDRRRGRERSGVARLCADMELTTGVEIGTAGGDSARLWCDTNQALHLTCIDPYIAYGGRRSQPRNDVVYQDACNTLAPYKNIVLLRETSMEAVTRFKDGSLDFLHIDGDHRFDAIVMDLVCWIPKVRDGGLITIHDYWAFWRSGVMKAVDAYTHCHRIDPWYVTRDMHPTAFWERGAERLT